MVGGKPVEENSQADPNPPANQVPKQAGRPSGTSKIKQEKPREYSQSHIQKTILDIDKFQRESISKFKKSKQIKRISKEQKQLVDQLCETIILSEAKENWQKILEKCL